MEILIWAGSVIALLGVVGLGWCIVLVTRAKREIQNDDDALRARVQKVVPINLASLFVSALGLMMLVIGLVLR